MARKAPRPACTIFKRLRCAPWPQRARRTVDGEDDSWGRGEEGGREREMEGGDGRENRFPADQATNRQGPRSLTQILQTAKHSDPPLVFFLFVRCLFFSLPLPPSSSLALLKNLPFEKRSGEYFEVNKVAGQTSAIKLLREPT